MSESDISEDEPKMQEETVHFPSYIPKKRAKGLAINQGTITKDTTS